MKGPLLLMALMPLLGQPLFADCEYAFSSARLDQCRPIELLDQPDGSAAWTYTEPGKGRVLAHLLCRCTSILSVPDKYCPDTRSVPVTTTLETNDIMGTCALKDALCSTPCASVPTPR
jgi:hypothetical protein